MRAYSPTEAQPIVTHTPEPDEVETSEPAAEDSSTSNDQNIRFRTPWEVAHVWETALEINQGKHRLRKKRASIRVAKAALVAEALANAAAAAKAADEAAEMAEQAARRAEEDMLKKARKAAKKAAKKNGSNQGASVSGVQTQTDLDSNESCDSTSSVEVDCKQVNLFSWIRNKLKWRSQKQN